MAFVFGFVIGLYLGVLVMSLKFKKQIRKMDSVVHMPSKDVSNEIFTAEDLSAAVKSEEA